MVYAEELLRCLRTEEEGFVLQIGLRELLRRRTSASVQTLNGMEKTLSSVRSRYETVLTVRRAGRTFLLFGADRRFKVGRMHLPCQPARTPPL